jgi:hypothetical protein
MQYDFNLLKELLIHGSTTSGTADPGASRILSQAGVGLVTTYIEKLCFLSLAENPVPLFGRDGKKWIGYSLTEKARGLVDDENAMKHALADLIGGPKNEISQAIYSLIEECQSANLREVYRNDFLRTLEEIAICFDQECYIATLSLSGKILEICLKEIVNRLEITIDPNSGIGTLLKKIRESDNEKKYYLDPGLSNIGHIINISRNTSIHANQSIPIPSRDQVVMVIFALRDVVRRVML